MAMKKTHKRKKYSRAHGRGMGTAGSGARKNNRKSGNSGGCGMSGSGKRADQKKTLVNKLYGNSYFGKKGITSRSTKKKKDKKIDLLKIEMNLESFIKKGIAKKTTKGYEIKLEEYKILGSGEVKNKLFITALSASVSAIEKVKSAGGKIELKNNSNEEETSDEE